MPAGVSIVRVQAADKPHYPFDYVDQSLIIGGAMNGGGEHEERSKMEGERDPPW